MFIRIKADSSTAGARRVQQQQGAAGAPQAVTVTTAGASEAVTAMTAGQGRGNECQRCPTTMTQHSLTPAGCASMAPTMAVVVAEPKCCHPTTTRTEPRRQQLQPRFGAQQGWQRAQTEPHSQPSSTTIVAVRPQRVWPVKEAARLAIPSWLAVRATLHEAASTGRRAPTMPRAPAPNHCRHPNSDPQRAAPAVRGAPLEPPPPQMPANRQLAAGDP